jgi:hypothetical protein
VNYNLVLGGVDALPGNEDGGSNEDIIWDTSLIISRYIWQAMDIHVPIMSTLSVCVLR